MLTSYALQYKLIGFNLPLAENRLVALKFHVVFFINARKWEPLTAGSIDGATLSPPRKVKILVTKDIK